MYCKTSAGQIAMNTQSRAEKTPELSVNESDTCFLSPIFSDEKKLKAEYRKRKNHYSYKSVHPADVEEEKNNGWIVQRNGIRSTRIKKQKSHDVWLEDRLWCLLYSMGYRILNGHNFRISFKREDLSTGRKQIDVYAEDTDTVFVIECKSKAEFGRRSLQKDIQETISLQKYLRNEINKRFSNRPKIIWIYATKGIKWSEPDIERALSGNIRIITENHLSYFETFIGHMGPAGKYQILGEFLDNQKIPGLSDAKLPAIRGKIGGEIFYSFVVTPRKLLKIAFVNHQALNHPGARPAYQRMISSKRVKEIGFFIEDGGYFPTNILINFVKKPRFDLISNAENLDENTKFGWLTLPSVYKSAWIIDGQHRLYGFSHLEDIFLDQNLFVLAFDRMSKEKEAKLFLTINHKQKSVPKGLLNYLLPDIGVGDNNPSTALDALCSSIVRELHADTTGPLAGRFDLPDALAGSNQSFTIAEAVKGLRRSSLIGKMVGRERAPGPLSGAEDAETIERASSVLNVYFEAVRKSHPTRWQAGKDRFVATNPGFRAHLIVIREIVSYLTHRRSLDFDLMRSDEFAEHILNFAEPIFSFFGEAGDEDVQGRFSKKLGEGGVKEYSYRLMEILAEENDGFGSEEFRQWKEQSESKIIDETNGFLIKFSQRLTDYVVDTLKDIHGENHLPSGQPAYWEIGVEKDRIRRNAFEAQQRDKLEHRGPIEAYLNIVDLGEIAKQDNNWESFEQTFNNRKPGDRGGQKYYLSWINEFARLRNVAAHPNQFKTYTEEDLKFVDWLRTNVSPKLP